MLCLQGLMAFCHYFLGQLHLTQARFADAKASLAAAKGYSDHDLPRMLGFRFHSFEATIKKAEEVAAASK
jgi:hypothetical protein